MIKAFGYIRLSEEDRNKKKNELETSLINQRKLIEKYCKENNKQLLKIYEDKYISGGDRTRKEFNEMIKLTNEGIVDEIIVKDSSRFCRDVGFFKDTLWDLNTYGKKIFSIQKNNYLRHNDLSDTIISAVDEHKINESREKQEILFKQKEEENLPVIKAPYGYKFNKKGGYWIPKPKESEIVKKAFELTLQNKNYKEICEELRISIPLYYKIIKNECYLSYIIYYKKIRNKDKIVIRTEKIKYKGTFEALISEELFNSVNKKIKARELSHGVKKD